MQVQHHFLSPVEVVKVTTHNLDEVAAWCGGTVHETESRRVPGRMDKYVLVPTPKGTNISWAFPGMYITKRIVVTVKDELRATWAVFRKDYFSKNYFETPEEAVEATWGRESVERNRRNKPRQDVVVNVSVGEAMKSAIAKIQKVAKEEGVTINVEEAPVAPLETEVEAESPQVRAHEEAVEAAANAG